jgi:hypothetical protein
MRNTYNPSRLKFQSRAPWLAIFLLAALACENTDQVSSPTADLPDAGAALSASSFQGIPFGSFAQPVSVYGPIYNGGVLNPVIPGDLPTFLSGIRAAGGRVALSLAGGPLGFTNADGTFNLDMWKGRIDRYRTIDFKSYIDDGTVLGSFLIDEPSCSTCWGGQSIPQSTVEAMAEYSKSIWPTMTTIARVDPTWLKESPNPYIYLDAGWAQYVVRKGDVNTFLSSNVAAAQSEGLRLIVGLNVLRGGLNQASLTASQIKNFGSVLLGSSYPCAFISWKYDAPYFSRSDIKSALSLLSKKARHHAPSACYN